jgi:LmbE family N-acetylglucosaminyl deacetylase
MRHSPSLSVRQVVFVAAALCLAMTVAVGFAPRGQAATPITTVIVTPHPDDEVLRLTGYVRHAAHRGDRLILVAVTDGGATGIRTKLGLSVDQLKAVRRAEQAAAWSYLTDHGDIIRLGLEDGDVPAHKDLITSRLKELAGQYPGAQFYVAARLDDFHADHRAVAEAVRDTGARVVRYSRAATDTGNGTVYRPPAGYEWGAARADAAYTEVGHASVAPSFDALRNGGYASRITAG